MMSSSPARISLRLRPPVVMPQVMPPCDDPDNLKPVRAKIDLAANESDLRHTQVGHLLNQVQALGRGQFIRAGVTRAGAAVGARQVAFPLFTVGRCEAFQVTPQTRRTPYASSF